MTVESDTSGIFREFSAADGFPQTKKKFQELCDLLEVDPTDNKNLYQTLKTKIPSAKNLWDLLDKRASQQEYMSGEPCKNSKVLIVGAGPCGLRMAVECALLGAKVVVVEMRDYITRNNVLHIWPFVTQDIRSLGGKVFYPQFCLGSLDHISIRNLQLLLLKLALVVGVEIHSPVKFVRLLEPDDQRGWRAELSPADHPVNQYEFDIMVGAHGGNNVLPDFTHKCFRGKIAIAITANFVRSHSREEAMVNELGGIFLVYNREFFQDMKKQCDIDLENMVYFKDETHYFVMTAKKESLLKKGVLKEDFSDTKQLLCPENVNMTNLLIYGRQAAEVTTQHKLSNLEYATNHYGEKDIAIFDFTAMYQAKYSCLAKVRHGKKLLMCIVGDTLIQPFWPSGSGCARGFLGVFDAAWLVRGWCLGETPEADLIAERETIFKLLSGAEARTLKKTYNKYTIDPRTRYLTDLQIIPLGSARLRCLYDTGEDEDCDTVSTPLTCNKPTQEKRCLQNVVRTTPPEKKLAKCQKAELAATSEIVKITKIKDVPVQAAVVAPSTKAAEPLNVQSLTVMFDKTNTDNKVQNNTSQAEGGAAPDDEHCCLCHQRVYVIDSQNAHGHICHKNCFRCNHCNSPLRVGFSVPKKDLQGQLQFYCSAHAYQGGVYDVNWAGPSSQLSQETRPEEKTIHSEETSSEKGDVATDVSNIVPNSEPLSGDGISSMHTYSKVGEGEEFVNDCAMIHNQGPRDVPATTNMTETIESNTISQTDQIQDNQQDSETLVDNNDEENNSNPQLHDNLNNIDGDTIPVSLIDIQGNSLLGKSLTIYKKGTI